MLKVKELIELVMLEALISAMKEKLLWKGLHSLPDRRLSKVNQTMENYIRVNEVYMICHPNRIALLGAIITLKGT